MAGTGTAYPADAVTGSPTYAALQGRNAFSAAMAGATSAKPLGGISGVRPGTSATSVTAPTSTTWSAAPMAGYIELESSTTNSGYFFAFGSTSTGTINAAAGSARVDLIYIQINDSNTSDGSTGAPRVVMDYQAGTAGAGVPTLSAARAFVIAQINVPASGGGSPTVSWVAPYCAGAGAILPAASSVLYPAAASFPGQYLDDMSTGSLKRSNGTAWVSVGGATVPVLPGSISGTGVAISGNTIVLTNATGADMRSLFTSTFDNYELVFDLQMSAASYPTAQLTAAGTPAPSQYGGTGGLETSGAHTPFALPAGFIQLAASVAAATGFQTGKVTVIAPAKATQTRYFGPSSSQTGLTSYTGAQVYGGHSTLAAYDGLLIGIQGTGTMSGTITITGIVK